MNHSITYTDDTNPIMYGIFLLFIGTSILKICHKYTNKKRLLYGGLTSDKVFIDKECIICLKEFESKDNVKVLPCKHVYHKDCILKWMDKTKECPKCRTQI